MLWEGCLIILKQTLLLVWRAITTAGSFADSEKGGVNK